MRKVGAQNSSGSRKDQIRALVRAFSNYLISIAYLKITPRFGKKASIQQQQTDLVERIIRPRLGKRKAAKGKSSEVARFPLWHVKRPPTRKCVLANLSKAFTLTDFWRFRSDRSNPCLAPLLGLLCEMWPPIWTRFGGTLRKPLGLQMPTVKCAGFSNIRVKDQFFTPDAPGPSEIPLRETCRANMSE
jgi:hypothetical protein